MIFVLAFFALALFSGWIYQRRAAARDSRRFPPPGRMVDVDGIRLHAHLTGTKTSGPLVVLEAGIAATSLSWALVQNKIGEFAPVLSYDRAGLGWSEPCSAPRAVSRITDELRRMLDAIDAPSPRVIVAHSFGGLIALDYAARFPDEIAGLVLVDPVGASEWAAPSKAHRAMLRRGIWLARCGQALASAGVVRFALDRLAGGARRLPKMLARASSGRRGQAFLERMAGEIQKLPRELWPLVQSHWCDPKCFRAMAAHLASLPESAAAILAEAKSIPAPLIVLSAGNASAAQRADHFRVAALSRQGEVRVIPDAHHWIQLDRPDTVVEAVRELLS
ncbi:MAG TPA: alpha/beta hydrolase [Bryobacteraceae bacterium]|nr:alpha/beta hydrolase [Bryobacteraceae bacterium]